MKLDPWPLDQPIPEVCRLHEVLRILRMSKATFHRLEARRELALVELPRLGRLRRFDGASVAAARRGRYVPNLRRVS